MGAVIRPYIARCLWFGAAVGFLATLAVQASVMAWYLYRNPPAMNGNKRTSYFLRAGGGGAEVGKPAFVHQVSIIAYRGAIEAQVSTYPWGSPSLPAGVEICWPQNEAAIPGVLRAMAKESHPGVSTPRLLRAFGWPWPCFRAACVWRGEWDSMQGLVLKEPSSGNADPNWREFIPISVYVPTMLADLAAIGIPAAALAAFLRFRRDQRVVGKCPTCGYNLAGLPRGSVCPECGSARRAPGVETAPTAS